MGFRSLVSLLPAIQATRLLVFALVGLSPTERASLRWTHRPTAGSRGSCAGSAPNLGVNRWTAAEVAGLPVPVGGRKPRGCQRMTVSGWTMMIAFNSDG